MKNASFSEFNQDIYLDSEIFKQKVNGVFIEIGAGDGMKFSNTYFFEKFRNWTGICIEPRVNEYQKLISNRKCICENMCISLSQGKEKFVEFSGKWLPMLSGIERNFHEEHKSKIREGMSQSEHDHRMSIREIPSTRLQTLLEKHGIFFIDYCSIDTEGSEMEILRSIDFNKTSIEVFTIENNYSNLEINEFMKTKGYKLIYELGKTNRALDQVYKKTP